MSDPILINGNAHSWASLKLQVGDGNPIYGWTAITFADKRERTLGWSQGRHHAPTRRSRGKYQPDPVKLTGYASAIQQLREDLAALSPDGLSYGDVEFQGFLSYFEAQEKQIDVVFHRLAWGGNSANPTEGPELLMDEIELSVFYITRNGLALFDNSEVKLV